MPTDIRVLPTDTGHEPDMTLAGAVTIDDVRAATDRIEGVAHRTPVMTSRHLDRLAGCEVFLKCENFQRTGSFKFRGAYCAIHGIRERGRSRGALAYSSGNHAQGVALAASMLGVPAVILMPVNAPKLKLEAAKNYLSTAPQGSEVVTFDPQTQNREELGRQMAEERKLELLPGYDNLDVIAGQGTVALELHEEAGPLDRLYVCCGGGGLISGCAITTRAVADACEVIGVEPGLGNDAELSFKTGTLHTVRNPATIADGARTPFLGHYTFPMVKAFVQDMMSVQDEELVDAMRLCMERMKIVVEPTGVLALAGLLRHARENSEAVEGKRIGVTISGGNIDLAKIGEYFKD